MVDLAALYEAQRRFFATGQTKDIAFRAAQLRELKKWIRENKERIYEALRQDLNKTAYEAMLTEVTIAQEEIGYALRHLRRWSKPRRAGMALFQFPARCRLYPEPYGLSLILSPWNYPFMLCAAPLSGAIAAGNCVILKPSAYAPATSRLLADMAKALFDPGHVAVVEGGRDEIGGLLEMRFDTIFFTGSTSVGRLVMEKAAKHLTPVTLELGGKSPCIVTESAHIESAAKRIVWGKTINAGQTCIAPDYVWVHESVRDALVAAMQRHIAAFYGEHPETNEAFPKIINQKHFDRLTGLLSQARVLYGGGTNPETHQIAPTLVDAADGFENPLMREEIFGPLLPVLSYADLEAALAQIAARPKPLALYVFTKDKAQERRVLSTVSFGGGCVNDTVLHIATSHMPFGGVGESGMGRYHGRWSFETFSHLKPVVHKGQMDFPIRYPPFRK